MRDFIDELDGIRHPPFGNFAFKVGQHVITAYVCIRFTHDNQQGPLAPLGMGDANDCGFGDTFTANSSIFNLNRCNVLSFGLNRTGNVARE